MNLLAEMTTHEAAAAAERGTVVVIPVGAVEQHGPALPLGTDTIRAEAFVAQLARALPDMIVVGPSLPVGVSPHHLAMAGTVSLRPDTFIAVLTDYLDSLAGHGWRRFLVVTGHGGNNAALGTLAQHLLRDRPEIEFAWTPITTLAKDAVAALDTTEVTGHGGEAETSQMLHIAPHLVRQSDLSPGSTELASMDALSQLARRGQPSLAVGYDRLSPNGILGDPRNATEENGRAIVDEAVERTRSFIEAWLQI